MVKWCAAIVRVAFGGICGTCVGVVIGPVLAALAAGILAVWFDGSPVADWLLPLQAASAAVVPLGAAVGAGFGYRSRHRRWDDLP